MVRNTSSKTLVALLFVSSFALAGCTDSDVSFNSVQNNSGTFDADFTGAGGSGSETFTWNNPSRQAELSMDITSAAGGSVTAEIRDADGKSAGTYTIDDDSGDDSIEGVTSTGSAGDWTIKVTLKDFDGDGTIHVGSAD